jgi:CRP-like cAMP-binding protein
MHQLLSDAERAQLATISSIVRFKKGETIYTGGAPAGAIFNIVSGIVATWKTGSDGAEHIVAFLYPGDLIGLSEQGRYENSARALTPVTAYSLPVPALRRRLSQDASLEFHVIAKLCHELRQAQRHALLLAEKHALSKLAMFLQLQEHLQASRGEPTAEVYLPMDRSDIAKYIGMSLAAVSRGFGALTNRRIIRKRDRRHVKIVNHKRLERLAGDFSGRSRAAAAAE